MRIKPTVPVNKLNKKLIHHGPFCIVVLVLLLLRVSIPTFHIVSL